MTDDEAEAVRELSEKVDELEVDMIERYYKRCIETIVEFGWMVQGVFPTEDSPGEPFAYTAGLTDLGHPEVAIRGIPIDWAHDIINDLAFRVKEGEVFTAGQRVTGLIVDADGNDRDVLLREANAQAFGGIIKNLYPQATGLQILIPDETWKFPGEDGYDWIPQEAFA